MQAFKFSFFKKGDIILNKQKSLSYQGFFLLTIPFSENWETCLESDLQKKEDIYCPLFDYYNNEKVN